LFCKKLPRTFDILDCSFDNLKKKLRPTVIDKDIRTMITNRRNKLISQVKLDMMAIYISTAEATGRAHAKTAKEEKEKLLLSLKQVAENVDEAILNNMINAIQTRQENIIKRVQYVTACKVSFFDETPTFVIE